MRKLFKIFSIVVLAVSLVISLTCVTCLAQKIHVPKGESKNMKLVGYHDMNGRGGSFKMALQKIGDKWYLYAAHLWHSGWTILDVTNPSDPKFVNWIQGPDNTGCYQVQVADDLAILGFDKKVWDGDPTKPYSVGIYIYDVKDPYNPKYLGYWSTGAERGVHKNFYVGGRYVHLAAADPGYRGSIYKILDIANPTNPVEVGRWALPGQEVGGTVSGSLHGYPFVRGNRAYLSYSAAGMIILDISDVTAPKLVSQLPFVPPFGGGGCHTVYPLMNPINDRKFAWVNGEGTNETPCLGAPSYSAMVDITDEKKPFLVSIMPVPFPPKNATFESYCAKGPRGRFGPHDAHHPMPGLPIYEEREDIIYNTYFAGGLRVFDITNPHHPFEIAHYVPPNPTVRYGSLPADLITSSEIVIADSRGNIYFTDKNWGVHIVRLTGPYRP